jgi:hypothetical protein
MSDSANAERQRRYIRRLKERAAAVTSGPQGIPHPVSNDQPILEEVDHDGSRRAVTLNQLELFQVASTGVCQSLGE